MQPGSKAEVHPLPLLVRTRHKRSYDGKQSCAESKRFGAPLDLRTTLITGHRGCGRRRSPSTAQRRLVHPSAAGEAPPCLVLYRRTLPTAVLWKTVVALLAVTSVGMTSDFGPLRRRTRNLLLQQQFTCIQA